MHLGHADGEIGNAEAAPKSASDLVPQPRRRGRRERSSGQVPAEASAAGLPGAARVGPVAGLCLPRVAGGHADEADRDGTVRVRQLSAEQQPHSEEERGLLEGGAALSGRHQLPDHFEPVDAASDRKSTRLNSSLMRISYAVFCLKKKKNIKTYDTNI